MKINLKSKEKAHYFKKQAQNPPKKQILRLVGGVVVGGLACTKGGHIKGSYEFQIFLLLARKEFTVSMEYFLLRSS